MRGWVGGRGPCVRAASGRRMNSPPGRGGRSRYGQHHHQQPAFPFVVDPTEGPPGVRAFFPAPEAGPGAEPSSSSSVEQQRYGRAAAEISLAHGMQHHRYHQFGVEGNRHQQDGGASSGSLPRHSGSPPGFFSSPVVVDNGKQQCYLATFWFTMPCQSPALRHLHMNFSPCIIWHLSCFSSKNNALALYLFSSTVLLFALGYWILGVINIFSP